MDIVVPVHAPFEVRLERAAGAYGVVFAATAVVKEPIRTVTAIVTGR